MHSISTFIRQSSVWSAKKWTPNLCTHNYSVLPLTRACMWVRHFPWQSGRSASQFLTIWLAYASHAQMSKTLYRTISVCHAIVLYRTISVCHAIVQNYLSVPCHCTELSQCAMPLYRTISVCHAIVLYRTISVCHAIVLYRTISVCHVKDVVQNYLSVPCHCVCECLSPMCV